MRLKIVILVMMFLVFQAMCAFSDAELSDCIGQMLVVGFRGTEINQDSYIVRTINELHIGGVILFDYDVPSKTHPRNIINPRQTKNLVTDLKKFTDNSLLICIDAEGGRVNRLKPKYGFREIPSPEYLGSKNKVKKTRYVISKLAKEIHKLGINFNFAPVVDLNLDPENPVIGALGRSFSNDPDVVIDNSRAFIETHERYNIITCLKHFPGHGSSSSDSHKGMVDVTDTYQEIELSPYKTLINEGKVNAIMTAHLFNRNIDPDYPATLSTLFIKNILRDELGFDGVVVSDDMHMGAITQYYCFEESLVLAINAGCDILILSNNSQIYDESYPFRAEEAIVQAVSEGRISEERIKESYQRIVILKKNIM